MLSIGNFSASNAYLTSCNVSLLNGISSSVLNSVSNVTSDIQQQLNVLTNNTLFVSCTNACISTLNTNSVTCTGSFTNSSRVFLNTLNCSYANISTVLSSCITSSSLSCSSLNCSSASFSQILGVSASFIAVNVCNVLSCSSLSCVGVSTTTITSQNILSTSSVNTQKCSCSVLNSCFLSVFNASSVSLNTSTLNVMGNASINGCLSVSFLICPNILTSSFINTSTINCQKSNLSTLNACTITSAILNTCFINGLNASVLNCLNGLHTNIQTQFDNITSSNGFFSNVTASSISVTNASVSALTSITGTFNNISCLSSASVVTINASIINTNQLCGYNATLIGLLQNACANIQTQINTLVLSSGSYNNVSAINAAISDTLNVPNITTSSVQTTTMRAQRVDTSALNVSMINGYSATPLQYLNGITSPIQAQISYYYGYLVTLSASLSKQNNTFISQINTLNTQVNALRTTVSNINTTTNSGSSGSVTYVMPSSISASTLSLDGDLYAQNGYFTAGVSASALYVDTDLYTKNGYFSTSLSASTLYVDQNTNIHGDLYAQNGFFTETVVAGFSDDRLKIRTESLSSCLPKILDLSTFKYVPNTEVCAYYDIPTRNTDEDIGLSAQEVQRVFPELVCLAPCDNNNDTSRTGEQFITIRYERFIPIVIQSIQDMYQEIKTLRLLCNNLMSAK